MRALKLAIGLVLALLVQLVGQRLFDEFFLVFDAFLLVALFNSLDARLATALAGGLVAGLAADALTGGLYGLHGFADTIVGYGTAFASQRLVIHRPQGVFLLFALAAASQQAIVIGLMLVFLSSPVFPGYPWVPIKVLAIGLVGAVCLFGYRRATRGIARWRRTRTARLALKR